jgi:hypothetical protein
MMHGVVMKITDECIVVLCNDGTFRNLPRPAVPPRLGETIPVPDDAVRPSPRVLRWNRLLKSGYGAAAAFLLFFGLAAWYFGISGAPGRTAAIVSVDINPGVELYVDRSGQVDKAVPVNDDATLLLTDVSLVGKELHEAVRLVILAAEAQGIWDGETGKRWIWISVVPLKDAPRVDPARIAPDDRNYAIELFTADARQMDEAKKTGLTLNKYIVYEHAKLRGIELDLADLKRHSITASLTRTGVEPETLFGPPDETAVGDGGDSLPADDPTEEAADRDDADPGDDAKTGTPDKQTGGAAGTAKGSEDGRAATAGPAAKRNVDTKKQNGDSGPAWNFRDRLPALAGQTPGWMRDPKELRLEIVNALKERAKGKKPAPRDDDRDGNDRNGGKARNGRSDEGPADPERNRAPGKRPDGKTGGDKQNDNRFFNDRNRDGADRGDGSKGWKRPGGTDDGRSGGHRNRDDERSGSDNSRFWKRD